MKAHLQYLKYVLRHKWFVFLECRKMGVPLLSAILHDWDKFLPDEWFAYVHFFHNPDGTKKQRRSPTGYYKPTDTGDAAFDYAWFLHQKRNKHHWQWWVMPEDQSGVKILEMSDSARREMLADWRGAGRAQGTPDTRSWYLANWAKLQMGVNTRKWVHAQLGLGYPKYATNQCVVVNIDNTGFLGEIIDIRVTENPSVEYLVQWIGGSKSTWCFEGELTPESKGTEFDK